ncbi:MAG: response regulator transcription factor [Thermoanaerobaculia bacterium]|nr:response regulator transcription factor [Thermoanaerobaculia bacterium]
MSSPNTTVSVVIVDDHEVVRRGLRALLADSDSVKVVGAAANGQEAVNLAAELRPDVVLMDILMPGKDGIEATREILQRFGSVHVVVLSSSDIDQHVLPALRAGALGYVSKNANTNELLEAIHQVAGGKPSMPAELTRQLLLHLDKTGPEEPLSPREEEILVQVAKGLGNREIGERLNISEGTVRTHVSNILGKIGASNRVEATLFALQQGITSLEESLQR